MNKISFDFDDTLSRKEIQNYAKELSERGYEIWICTTRYTPEETGNQQDILEVAQALNIPRERMIFTEWRDKYPYLEGFILHLDDDFEELDMLNKNTKVIGISTWGTNNWKKKCEKVLKSTGG